MSLLKRIQTRIKQQRQERERRAFIRMCVAARFAEIDAWSNSKKLDVWRECIELWYMKPDDC